MVSLAKTMIDNHEKSFGGWWKRKEFILNLKPNQKYIYIKAFQTWWNFDLYYNQKHSNLTSAETSQN